MNNNELEQIQKVCDEVKKQEEETKKQQEEIKKQEETKKQQEEIKKQEIKKQEEDKIISNFEFTQKHKDEVKKEFQKIKDLRLLDKTKQEDLIDMELDSGIDSIHPKWDISGKKGLYYKAENIKLITSEDDNVSVKPPAIGLHS